MNSDLSIHRMAFREAESMSVAQALVVKKRQEMELRLIRERVAQGADAKGAALDTALRNMDEGSEAQTRALDSDLGTVVDKTA